MSVAEGHALAVVKQLRQKKYQTEITKSLPKVIPAERFFRMAATELARDPKLAGCSRKSLMNAVIEASHMGLCFDSVLGHAYIIPYKDEAKFQLGYKGYIVLARRSGSVNHVETAVVYEGDDFSYRFGTRAYLDHTPVNEGDKRGQMIGAWCKVTYPNGLESFDYMPRVDIETIRTNAPGSRRRDSPWNKHTGEMYRKTVMIRHLKTRGISPEVTFQATQEEMYNAGLGMSDEQRAAEAREVKAELVEREKFGETMANGRGVQSVASESEPIPESKGTPRALKKAERQDLYVEYHRIAQALGRKSPALDRMDDAALEGAVKMMRQLQSDEKRSSKPRETVPAGDSEPSVDPDEWPFPRDE